MPTSTWFHQSKPLLIDNKIKGRLVSVEPRQERPLLSTPVFILKETLTCSQIFPVDQIQYFGINFYIKFPGKQFGVAIVEHLAEIHFF
jgi:hypothetical protein